MTKPRVTQKDIAKAAGVTQTTVSYALHGGGKISDKTRDEILTIAKQLGYHDDPMLRSLAVYRNKKQTEQNEAVFHGTIAWLIDVGQHKNWVKSDLYESYHSGAQKAAKRLGYTLEPLSLDDPNLSLKRAHQILNHRGIQGALFAVPPDVDKLDQSQIYQIDWKDIPIVALGSWPYDAKFHMVCSNQFDSLCLCIDQTISRGYKRIAFVIEESVNQRVNGRFLGAYQTRKEILNPKGVKILDPLLVDWNTWEEQLKAWIIKNQPDVIIGLLFETGTRFKKVVGELKLKVPKDIAIVSMDAWREIEGCFAGVDENLESIGYQSVRLLDSLIRHDERGAPEHPIRQMVQPSWLDGKSIKKRV
ncbi:MAG: LacI family DNA-binding transcriptional regulator [Verrucomicrobiota bacterium]